MVVCAACERAIPRRGAVYVLDIALYAAAGPLEVEEADLASDLEGELLRMGAELERLTAEEAEEGVHRRFRFELCRPCQSRYVRDPLGRGQAG